MVMVLGCARIGVLRVVPSMWSGKEGAWLFLGETGLVAALGSPSEVSSLLVLSCNMTRVRYMNINM